MEQKQDKKPENDPMENTAAPKSWSKYTTSVWIEKLTDFLSKHSREKYKVCHLRYSNRSNFSIIHFDVFLLKFALQMQKSWKYEESWGILILEYWRTPLIEPYIDKITHFVTSLEVCIDNYWGKSFYAQMV